MMARAVLTVILGLSLCLVGPAASPLARAAAPPTVLEPEVPLAHSLAAFRQAVRPGGPGKDGIPAIDRPRFESVAEADAWLAPGDRVIGLQRDGEARAYPQRILVWHEIVNDVVAGTPLSVTYCPLTGSALGFRRGDGTFGVSGRLVNSNLVMYDRATDSEWPQLLGVAIDGSQAGRGLVAERLVWTTWGAWKARHPGTRVLSRDTGYVRNYRRDPYGGYNPRRGYYLPDSGRLFPVMAEDARLPPKAMVLAFREAGGAAAVSLPALREAGMVRLTLGERAYVVIHDPGLDTGWVYRHPQGQDIDPAALRFGPGGAGGPGGEALTSVPAFQVMWFAWAAFHPDTLLIGEGGTP
ncbi:DUF3179 domain-containing protein [Halomonas nitroreducens]|uniref:DUF3179 domain-containing protein n=1 Tax=Halomonas nitroreducens TaxID=447425 RepID=A0A431V8T9_9GAMM|nr:DUF3179 domain-containing protein [Halomonas nitroreducens]RTR07097.1 DUF3179 domain-containing protein [Halomonas nitroreducens]